MTKATKIQSCQTRRRSDCPVSYALEVLGDRWTLLIIRDLLFAGKQHYRQFLRSDEKIATNILADRLRRLEAAGIVEKGPDPKNRRAFLYELTRKGTDLAPALLELIRWAARHDPDSAVPDDYMRVLDGDRDQAIASLKSAPGD